MAHPRFNLPIPLKAFLNLELLVISLKLNLYSDFEVKSVSWQL
jgi:hypothetical protein